MPIKDWEEGDEHLLVRPERDYTSRVFFYKRYVRLGDSACPVRCGCSYVYCGFSLCPNCASLNTTIFYGMSVPINPDDWRVLKDVMTTTHLWSDKQLYEWAAFWVKCADSRLSYTKQLVFFRDDKFLRLSTHEFFQYLYDFIVIRKVPHANRHVPNDQHRVHGDRAVVFTADAAIRASFMIYGPMRARVTGITTIGEQSSIYFSDVPNPRNDAFAIAQWLIAHQEKDEWKHVFRSVTREIEEEVRYRPGMCGMRECQDSFSKWQKCIPRTPR